MGTTLTALQAGSISFKFVAAIEGYPYLLTDATTAQATAAWIGTDWTQALGGLYVELKNQQRIHPWDPFQGGGKCILRVAPDSTADTFGVDVHRKTAGAETTLTATIDRDDGTITVASTTGFAAAGEFHIGTECIASTGATATTFTGCTRGRYSPFGTSSSARFAEHHRYGVVANGVNLSATVSAQPRVWIGRWVGVWLHRVVDGVLDIKAEAQLVFAGRIVSTGDDPNTFCTVLELEHVHDVIRNAVVGRDMWSARVQEGVYIPVDTTFEMSDRTATNVARKTANPLKAVAGAPASANELKAGRYSLAALASVFNKWWVSESGAGRITGSYELATPVQSGPNALRSQIRWHIFTGAAATTDWSFTLPEYVKAFLGYDKNTGEGLFANGTRVTIGDSGSGAETHVKTSEFAPLSTVIYNWIQAYGDFRFDVVDERGTFIDQYANFPPPPPEDTQTKDWGIFLLDNRFLIRGAKVGTTIQNVAPIFPVGVKGGLPVGIGTTDGFSTTVEQTAGPISIRQLMFLDGAFSDLLLEVMCSTGTAAYNHATYDVLGYGLGIGIPGYLLTDVIANVSQLPSANTKLRLVLEEPTKFSDLFGSDFVLRRSFLRWNNGRLDVRSWLQPTSSAPVATLDESTKGAPTGHQDNHRSATVTTDEWLHPIVKIDYDRDVNDAGSSAYKSSLTLEDSVAVDDAGGEAGILTIRARNMYSQYSQGGASIEALLRNFLATMPLFSRARRKLGRSIDPRYFEGLSIGDGILLSDMFARDPDTGARRITTRSAVVIAHSYSLGGRQYPGADPAPMGGEIEVFLLDVDRIAAYAPAAEVDSTAANAGYDAANKRLTCTAHTYSRSTDIADATRFPATSKVRVVERDPANPASPLTWTDTVTSQTGNTITLTTGLTSPAWDNTKKYVVIFDAFSTCTATQQAKCFQADDADMMIQDLRRPFELTGSLGDLTYTANSASDPIELPADVSYGDGKPLDVAHELALSRLVNNLHDYKTARSSPFLLSSNVGATSGGGSWQLLAICPIFLTPEQMSDTCRRLLVVAPCFRSQVGGVSHSVRVTLSDRPPSLDTTLNVDRGTNFASATWSTTSATYVIGADASLDMRMKSLGIFGGLFGGLAWLYLEGTDRADIRGLAKCHEGARIPGSRIPT